MKDWKDRIKGDYSDLRGVCHNPKAGQTKEEMAQQLEYAARLNLNAVRFWMSQEEWEKNPEAYEKMLLDFTDSCEEKGIGIMPIFWNGNFIEDYTEAGEEEWKKKRTYAEAIICLLKPKKGLLMWDVFNEPFCNTYLGSASPEDYPRKKEKLAKDLRKHCELIRELDPDTPITVGHELSSHMDSTSDLVDVLSFHDYMPTRSRMEAAYQTAGQLSEAEGGKPILNTETGCIGRATPYDLELEMCEKYHCGFFLFNLMIEGFWGEIHGLVYPDGTIRDPGIVAALYGFRRNCGDNRILARGNREGHALKAVKAVEDVLKLENKAMFVSKAKSTDEILEAAEYCINILEPCELVPMWDSLSAQLCHYRSQKAEERDEWEIQRFAYDCAIRVKQAFLIM